MRKKICLGVLSFILAGAASFFGVQFVTKTGIFKVPGELIFAESFPDSEAEKIRTLFEVPEGEKKLVLDKNLTIHKTFENKKLAKKNYYLREIYVPTTDFYDTDTEISAEKLRDEFESGAKGVIPVEKLDSSVKLLAVDGDYYLDEFDTGALFEYLVVEGESEEDLALFGRLITPTLSEFPEEATTLTLAQTGVTALSRRMNGKLDQVDDGAYFAENIGSFLKSFDLTHTSNESSFTDLASTTNICSKWGFVDTLTAIGLDIVELTGNHNVDCGATAAIETADKYDELGIAMVGGGRNATEAAMPLEIEKKGTNITFLAYNQSTGGATTGDAPGANQYYPVQAKQEIEEAKARGDIVIVDMQYYECNEYDYSYEVTTCDYAYSSAGDQVGVFRSLIDYGADVVVGTAAHQTQTYERYGDGEIYYGLGNLFFDQVWWPGTTRSLGLTHYFWNGKLLQTRKFGTVYDETYQTRLMDDEELEWFINRLNQARDDE